MCVCVCVFQVSFLTVALNFICQLYGQHIGQGGVEGLSGFVRAIDYAAAAHRGLLLMVLLQVGGAG